MSLTAAPPPVLQVRGPQGPWAGALATFERTGVAVVCATQEDWRPHLLTGQDLKRLLGRDFRRFRSLASDELRARFVASRMLVKHLAAGPLQVRPEDLELGYGMHGRMYLRGCEQVEISLSHTRDVLLVGISSVGLIGVDTEPADRKLYGRDVERLMCTPHERSELDALELGERNDRLLRLWTLKEAYSKALGQGLLFPFTEFGFVPSGWSAQLARADGTPVGDAQWRYWTVPVAERFLGAIAVQNNRRSDRRDTRVGTALPQRLVNSIQTSLRARAG